MKYVASVSPDIIGLQEVLWEQLNFVDSALRREYAWFGVGRDDGGHSGEFSPIFVRRGKFTVEDQGTFWLSSTPHQPGTSFSRLARIVSWVAVRDVQSEKKFFVFNTHFDHESERARDESAALLLAKINQIAGLYACIVAGDFNMEQASNCYRVLTSSFLRDVCADHALLPATFTGWQNSDAMRIDFILTSGFESREFKVHVKSADDGSDLSDHRMVSAIVRVCV